MAVVTEFRLDVLYGQLCVYRGDLDRPFNDWQPEHVAQGFSWRPGTVSFRTLREDGPHLTSVQLVERLGEPEDDVIRCIDVPFERPAGIHLEIGSVIVQEPLVLPSGPGRLRCEFVKVTGKGVQRVRLTFATRDAGGFEVVRADAELSPGRSLLLVAEPA